MARAVEIFMVNRWCQFAPYPASIESAAAGASGHHWRSPKWRYAHAHWPAPPPYSQFHDGSRQSRNRVGDRRENQTQSFRMGPGGARHPVQINDIIDVIEIINIALLHGEAGDAGGNSASGGGAGALTGSLMDRHWPHRACQSGRCGLSLSAV